MTFKTATPNTHRCQIFLDEGIIEALQEDGLTVLLVELTEDDIERLKEGRLLVTDHTKSDHWIVIANCAANEKRLAKPHPA